MKNGIVAFVMLLMIFGVLNTQASDQLSLGIKDRFYFGIGGFVASNVDGIAKEAQLKLNEKFRVYLSDYSGSTNKNFTGNKVHMKNYNMGLLFKENFGVLNSLLGLGGSYYEQDELLQKKKSAWGGEAIFEINYAVRGKNLELFQRASWKIHDSNRISYDDMVITIGLRSAIFSAF